MFALEAVKFSGLRLIEGIGSTSQEQWQLKVPETNVLISSQLSKILDRKDRAFEKGGVKIALQARSASSHETKVQ